jgi:large subunit ribosomal protein L24
MKIKTGDKVLVRKGRERGKTGKILQTFPRRGLVVVEGLNMRKRHIRPQKQGEKGQVVDFSAPIVAANVALICPKCEAPTRIGSKQVTPPTGKTQKLRVCKKCGETSE